MALLTVTINDPSLNRKSAEVAFAENALDIVKKELGKGRGTVTTGTILGVSAAGVANTSLGTWTYTATATTP